MAFGLIAGAFDVIHPGYIEMFKFASANSTRLCIALHDDPSLERPNKLKPILNVQERAAILKSIIYIDDVWIYSTESDLHAFIETYKPTIFVGDDYSNKPITGDSVEGIEIKYIPRNHGWSTTLFKQLIADQINAKNNH